MMITYVNVQSTSAQFYWLFLVVINKFMDVPKVHLILLRAGLFEKHNDVEPKEVRVSSYQKYETTAVDYKMIFLLEFIFENDISLDTRVAVIKELQEFFSKV